MSGAISGEDATAIKLSAMKSSSLIVLFYYAVKTEASVSGIFKFLTSFIFREPARSKKKKVSKERGKKRRGRKKKSLTFAAEMAFLREA